MVFKDKKGITVASGFKLQAAALLDARGQVKTIAERDELVTLNAVTPGLRVYVEETKTSYVYNGSGWDELTKGAGYTHPNTPGNKHIPAGGVSGQVLGWSADGQAKWVEDKDTTYNPATTGTNGLMSAADKTKLDGIAEGANNYSHPKTHAATMIVQDAEHRFVSDVDKQGWSDKYTKNEVDNKLSALETKLDWKEAVKTFADIAKTYPNPEDGWTVNVKDDDVTYRYTGNKWVAISANSIPLATKDLDGRMSKSDKAKLDGIAAGANNYTHPDTSGNKHIPAGGASGQVLGWSADGQAKWVEDKDTTYSPATTATNGLMSAADKAKLDGVAEGANNYTHPEHHPATVITEDDNHQFVTKAQKEAIDNMPSIGFGREYPQEAAPNSLFFLIG